jgi:hypothetical protein
MIEENGGRKHDDDNKNERDILESQTLKKHTCVSIKLSPLS